MSDGNEGGGPASSTLVDSPPQPHPAGVPAAMSRTLRFRGQQYPVVLPTIRDPRLHLAAVILSIHVLGQTVLGFGVSVPQILSAILTCFLIEVTWTFHRTRAIVWPASAMLTGSGVALIFRVVGTESGEHWKWSGWHLFALVAGFSLLTKYLVRYRGSHVFNPSNLGLVVAFLVLGSTRVEPLDFWWAPLDTWMATAYAIILVGGVLITARLRLLAMATTFWLTLASGLGMVAASGHCMTARWAFRPVCGSQFWWVIVTSPEVLIFLFFMITDPKTIPMGRVSRIVFGGSVGLVDALLIAPQTTEFGAKVALLGGLVIACGIRALLDFFLVAATSGQGQSRQLGPRFPIVKDRVGIQPVVARRAVAVASLAVLSFGMVAGATAGNSPSSESSDVSANIEVQIDASKLPGVTVDDDIEAWNADLGGPGAQLLAVTLAENLEIENQALLKADETLLAAVDHGDRLREMQQRINQAITTGSTVVQLYTFDSIHISPILPFGSQGGLSMGLEGRGTLEELTYGAAGDLTDRASSTFAVTFVMRQATGGRWLIVATLP